MQNQQTKIALIDDHELLRNGLARIIDRFDEFTVVIEAGNGKEFIENMGRHEAPDIVLLDISMPEMDGFETAAWIKRNMPQIKILVLSMSDKESMVIRMINLGARGYILKDSKPAILREALESILTKGYYSNDLLNSRMIHEVEKGIFKKILISPREEEFLQLACSEMTYKEIAEMMHASPRTIDNYRDNLFEKFDIKSRVGLALFAIKQGYYQI